jgi:hypothetical protein
MILCREQVWILVNTIFQKVGTQVPTLGLLTALVALAHGVLLLGWPGFERPETPPRRPVFVMRAVAVSEPVHSAIAQVPPSADATHAPVQKTAKSAGRQLALPTPPTTAAPTVVLTQAREPAATTLLALAAPESSAPKASEPSAHQSVGQAVTFAVPKSVRLAYDVAGEVKGFSYSASSELLWQQDGQQYNAKNEIKVFLLGSRSQTSTGQISSGGLEPTRFSDKARSEQAAHFERDKGIIVFSANAPSAVLLPGAQDRLSVVLQLSAMLAGAPTHYPPGTVIALQVVGPRDAEDWRFTVGETEALKLPGGSVTGVKLSRQPRSAYDQKLDLWLAPSMAYLPVRLRLSQDNGDYVDQKWRASLAP